MGKLLWLFHDYLKYCKYGYGRAADSASYDIRNGYISRQEGVRLVEKYALEKAYIKKTVCHFRKKELNKELKRIETTDPYSLEEYRKFKRSALK